MVPSCISCQLEQCRYPRWTAVRDACRTLHIPDNQPKRRKNTALVNCIYLFRMHAWSRTEWSLVWFIGFEITLWFVTNVGIEDKWHTRYAKTLILWQTLLTAKKTAWASGMTNTRTSLICLPSMMLWSHDYWKMVAVKSKPVYTATVGCSPRHTHSKCQEITAQN